MDSWFFLFFPAISFFAVADLEEAKKLAGKSRPPDSDHP